MVAEILNSVEIFKDRFVEMSQKVEKGEMENTNSGLKGLMETPSP